MNKYQKVINQIAKDDMKARFARAPFVKIRKEIRNFTKEFHYNLKELIEHNNYCKGINEVIIAHKNHINEVNRKLDLLERR